MMQLGTLPYVVVGVVVWWWVWWVAVWDVQRGTCNVVRTPGDADVYI